MGLFIIGKQMHSIAGDMSRWPPEGELTYHRKMDAFIVGRYIEVVLSRLVYHRKTDAFVVWRYVEVVPSRWVYLS